MPRRLFSLFVLSLALPTALQAQDLQQLMQQYGNQLEGKKLPQQLKGKQLPPIDLQALRDAGSGKQQVAGVLARQLVALQRSGLINGRQADALTRAFRNAPQRTVAMVGEVQRFASQLRDPAQLASLKRQLGCRYQAATSRRLLMAGARNVLAGLARRASSLRELDGADTRPPGLTRSLATYATRTDAGGMRIPLGGLAVDLYGGGSFNIVARSGKPLVITRTDPIYLTPWHIANRRPATSWKEPICVYHFPERGWTFIGMAQNAAARTNRLLASDGQRTLIITGVDCNLNEIRVATIPFVNQVAELLARKQGVEQLTYRKRKLRPLGPVMLELTQAGGHWPLIERGYRVHARLEDVWQRELAGRLLR